MTVRIQNPAAIVPNLNPVFFDLRKTLTPINKKDNPTDIVAIRDMLTMLSVVHPFESMRKRAFPTIKIFNPVKKNSELVNLSP